MANQWLRLWHDMPNDPKWRTIARVSGQPIVAVISVYIHLLVIASNATERGRTHDANAEDIASALDLDAEQVLKIISAMQGRVLDGDLITGWSKRQVAREDGSAERARAWREARANANQTEVKQGRTQANASELKETPDTDTDTDTEKKKAYAQLSGFAEFWSAYPRKKNKGDAEKAWRSLKPDGEMVALILAAVALGKSGNEWQKDGGQFIPYPASWLRARGWEDEVKTESYSDAELGVFSAYNQILAAAGWPEAVVEPFSRDRASAIGSFIGLRTRDGWIDTYFAWLSQNLEPRAGYGFDWVIRTDTVLRAREGNFQALREAA